MIKSAQSTARQRLAAMEMSIGQNSVCLRLDPEEVDALLSQGVVAMRTRFPGGHEIRYVAESSPASVTAAAFYSENTITVRLPETHVLAWAKSRQSSIDEEQVLADGQRLRIRVDKAAADPAIAATGAADGEG